MYLSELVERNSKAFFGFETKCVIESLFFISNKGLFKYSMFQSFMLVSALPVIKKL
jgi:hypothetical protein